MLNIVGERDEGVAKIGGEVGLVDDEWPSRRLDHGSASSKDRDGSTVGSVDRGPHWIEGGEIVSALEIMTGSTAI